MSNENRPRGNGLKWRKRQNAADVPYWFASDAAMTAGYPVKSANLSTLADRPVELEARAVRLQTEMQLWLRKAPKIKPAFDGTFSSLLHLYETDPESTFHKIKGANVRGYLSYIRKLRKHVGDVRLDDADGRDAKRWFAEWRTDPDGRDRLPRARFVLAVLKAAVSFGVICRLQGVKDFQDVLGEIEFPTPASRTFAPTANDIIAARRAAHAAGHPERALVYSLQFETTLRQWDIIGTWLPMSDPKPSTVHFQREKWVGPVWSSINANGIMKVRPTKTEDTTAVEVAFDLSACPMVQEDLAAIPEAKRVGPLIIFPATGRPYKPQSFWEGWKADFKAAGLPAKMWGRDIRAGGATEARQGGGRKDDLKRVMGHTKEATTDLYDRDTVEAHRRLMAGRVKHRENSK